MLQLVIAKLKMLQASQAKVGQGQSQREDGGAESDAVLSRVVLGLLNIPELKQRIEREVAAPRRHENANGKEEEDGHGFNGNAPQQWC